MVDDAVFAPPAGLAEAGLALWEAILRDLPDGLDLDARELHFLGRAARCADDIAALEAQLAADGLMAPGSMGQPVLHPAVAELRQLRLVELRLLAQLDVHGPAEGRR